MKTPLGKKELTEYKEKLLKVRDELRDQIKEISDDTLMKSQKDMSGDISGYSLHIADMASDNYERDFNLGIVSGERKVLMEVEEALKRIEDKVYGVCATCEKPIAKIRLNAVPHAQYCKKCQEKLEKDNQI